MVTFGRQRRMVINFRKVNAVAKKDAYPLPYIDAILPLNIFLPLI